MRRSMRNAKSQHNHLMSSKRRMYIVHTHKRCQCVFVWHFLWATIKSFGNVKLWTGGVCVHFTQSTECRRRIANGHLLIMLNETDAKRALCMSDCKKNGSKKKYENLISALRAHTYSVFYFSFISRKICKKIKIEKKMFNKETEKMPRKCFRSLLSHATGIHSWNSFSMNCHLPSSIEINLKMWQ